MSEGISIAPRKFNAALQVAICIACLTFLLYVASAFLLGSVTYIMFNLYLFLATTLGVVVSLWLVTHISSSVLLSLTTITFALLL